MTLISTLDENPNCDKVTMSFRLIGDDLDPDEVTSRLGITPEWALARGERRPAPPLQGRPQEAGVWLISTEGQVESTSAERHLVWLLERIEPVADAVLEVRREQGLTADFFCGWFSLTGHGGPDFSPEVLSRVAALDATLSLDFY